jgi:hypothetical protein
METTEKEPASTKSYKSISIFKDYAWRYFHRIKIPNNDFYQPKITSLINVHVARLQESFSSFCLEERTRNKIVEKIVSAIHRRNQENACVVTDDSKNLIKSDDFQRFVDRFYQRHVQQDITLAGVLSWKGKEERDLKISTKVLQIIDCHPF